MRRWAIAIGVFLSISCASTKIRPDLFQGSIDSNYHSVELKIGHQRFLGTAHALVKDKLTFEVTGYYSGMIRVDSEECSVSESRAYFDFTPIEFSIPMISERCLFAISVTPYFSEKEAGNIKWRGMKGLILARKTNKKALLSSSQLPFGASYTIHVKSNDESKLRLKGCGIDYKRTLLKGEYDFTFDVFNSTSEDLCVFDGYIRGKKDDLVISALVAKFSGIYSRLPFPQILIRGNKVIVRADTHTSLMNYNGESVFSDEAIFKFKENEILRLYTSNGRTLFCEVGKDATKCYQ